MLLTGQEWGIGFCYINVSRQFEYATLSRRGKGWFSNVYET